MSMQQKVVFLIILLVGLSLRLFSIETNGLWLDEIWSMLASDPNQSWQEVIRNALNDTHPPLFDLLLYGSLKLTNNAEFTARYLALSIGLLGMVLSYHYGKKISGESRIGLLLMAVCSLNFFHIYYSIEGRFYSLLFLLSLTTTAEFYLYFRDGKSKNAWRYLGSAILLCYTHYYGGILLASISVVALLYWLSKEISRKQFFQFVGLQIIVLVAFSPCFPYLFKNSGGSSWMSVPGIGDFFNYFYLYSGKNPLEFAWLFLPLLFYFKVEKDKKLKLLLYLSIILSFLIPFILSNISTPMLHKRYTLIYLPAIFIMSAMACKEVEYRGRVWSKWIYLMVGLSCILNILFLRSEFKEGAKDQWKEVAQYLKEEGAGKVTANQEIYLDFYLEREGMKKTDPIEELEGEFWLLKTNFDEEDWIMKYNLEVLETKEFPKDFYLYRVIK